MNIKEQFTTKNTRIALEFALRGILTKTDLRKNTHKNWKLKACIILFRYNTDCSYRHLYDVLGFKNLSYHYDTGQELLLNNREFIRFYKSTVEEIKEQGFKIIS